MADQQVKRGKKAKRPDTRPARARYWTTKQLEKHKVRNLVRCNGMSKVKALQYWREVRKRRMRSAFKEAV